MILLGPGALLFWVHYTGGNPGHQNRRGQPLVQMITSGRRADRWREGIDYEMLKGQDLQDFWAVLSQRERTYPQVSSLMILYTSGIHLVLLNTSKPIGTELHRWLVDEVFPSLKETGSYHLNPSDREALPVPALFTEEIRKALSKIKSSFVISQKDHPIPRDFAIEWDETHKAHTASMFYGVGKTSQQIKAIARQRGVKVLSNTSARKLMYDMVDFRHTNISESAEIDFERIGLPHEQARQIAITQGQPYFKALVDAGVNQDSLQQSS
jgi:hypothetical protein